MVGDPKGLPTSVAPECLVDFKNRTETKSSMSSRRSRCVEYVDDHVITLQVMENPTLRNPMWAIENPTLTILMRAIENSTLRNPVRVRKNPTLRIA